MYDDEPPDLLGIIVFSINVVGLSIAAVGAVILIAISLQRWF